ncbi:MBL fold metallo-hydrolase [Nocardia sp. CA2R105]|uniref:MBL fold metallo-hydrolase n=1 Tax=Nocardia coffeae TaxID=2873381 RepID=UPI001CA6686B|nr:MBL fold metallo-hydrolase [Nocardia coffeae]MBY8855809.1 MBL fold metallo-hydrolase [Nocardia coffeae]
MSEPVRSPNVFECCSAATSLVRGMVRPRKPDESFLRSIADAGLPTARRTVEITTLEQVPRAVPTPMVVEGRFDPRRIRNALTSFVVRHPEATFLVDPSFCLDAERRAIAELPAIVRVAVRPPAGTIATVTALKGETRLPAPDFALPTHAHWDHVCGLLDFPGLPVHLHSEEHRWIVDGVVAPVGGVRDSLRDRPVEQFDLDGPPVLTFTRSRDLFGDGSVVLVDLAGHTPGSIGILCHTSTGWVLLAGDAAWHHLQIEDIRQKSGYPGLFADVDRDATFRTLHRLHLARHTVTIVPTHDHDASSRFTTGRIDSAQALL